MTFSAEGVNKFYGIVSLTREEIAEEKRIDGLNLNELADYLSGNNVRDLAFLCFFCWISSLCLQLKRNSIAFQENRSNHEKKQLTTIHYPIRKLKA